MNHLIAALNDIRQPLTALLENDLDADRLAALEAAIGDSDERLEAYVRTMLLDAELARLGEWHAGLEQGQQETGDALLRALLADTPVRRLSEAVATAATASESRRTPPQRRNFMPEQPAAAHSRYFTAASVLLLIGGALALLSLPGLRPGSRVVLNSPTPLSDESNERLRYQDMTVADVGEALMEKEHAAEIAAARAEQEAILALRASNDKVGIQKKLAEYADQFSALIGNHRFREAEMVLAKADLLAPNEPLVIQLKATTQSIRQVSQNADSTGQGVSRQLETGNFVYRDFVITPLAGDELHRDLNSTSEFYELATGFNRLSEVQTDALRNPIDAFVLSRLTERDSSGRKSTKNPQLLRRATLDSTGLPPNSQPGTVELLEKPYGSETNGYTEKTDAALADVERQKRHLAKYEVYYDQKVEEKHALKPGSLFRPSPNYDAPMPPAPTPDNSIAGNSAGHVEVEKSEVNASTQSETLAKQLTAALEVLHANDLNLSSADPASPTSAVDGLVSKVSKTGKLIEVTIGFDDGVRKDDTMEVFNDKHYLGRLKVIDTTPDSAVGRMEVLNGAIERGDRVATRISTPESTYDRYERIIENDFQLVTDRPLSTFSVDVDTASYANTRQYLMQSSMLPPADAVRIEEMINYFDYDYAGPTGDDPFASHIEIASCAWQPKHRLVRVALKGKEMDHRERPESNLVFLVDVSGSMDEPQKLPLVKEGLKLLTKQLGASDRVAIVVYAGAAGLVLDSTVGDETKTILAAIDALNAGGSTAGGEGIELAYQTAIDNYIRGGTNRVILCTDGDFNVGVSDTAELEKLAEKQAESGVFLSVMGFGRGNLNDAMMERISNKGNGNYAYIDTTGEAQKVFVEQMSGMLVTIAKDVKIQIEFNPAAVAGYRLIGYENRLMAKEDFNDDTKDAGEIGAGHTVTALYEVVPVGQKIPTPGVDELKYQQPTKLTAAARSGELLTLKLRYKQPTGVASKLLQFPVKDAGKKFDAASDDFRFASAVAAFGMLLRGSSYGGDATYDSVADLAAASKGADRHGYRAELIEMVKQAKKVDRRR